VVLFGRLLSPPFVPESLRRRPAVKDTHVDFGIFKCALSLSQDSVDIDDSLLMIITEPVLESLVKPGESSPLIGEESPTSNPPPAYIQNQPYFRYHNTQPRSEYRRSPTWRFTEAFCVAIVITTLLSALASTVVWIANDKAHHSQVSLEII